MPAVISEFQGEWRFLSNFWPTQVQLGGEWYPTVEHAYQAAKTLDPQERDIIRVLASPGQAKREGRRVAIRNGWDGIKQVIMLDLVRQKFDWPIMAAKLLATGDAVLEEGNAWGDRFWGISPVGSGQGKNTLGKLLMKVRRELREI